MERVQVPVVVHKWFPDGDGWAWHPSLKDRRDWASKAVDKYLKASIAISEEFVVEYDDVTLVGVRAPDRNCPDPKAVNRKPFILRFGLVPKAQANKATIRRVREELDALDLPGKRGECPGLEISLAPAELPVVAPIDVAPTKPDPVSGTPTAPWLDMDSAGTPPAQWNGVLPALIPKSKDGTARGTEHKNQNQPRPPANAIQMDWPVEMQKERARAHLIRRLDDANAENAKLSRVITWNIVLSLIWLVVGGVLTVVWWPAGLALMIPPLLSLFVTAFFGYLRDTSEADEGPR